MNLLKKFVILCVAGLAALMLSACGGSKTTINVFTWSDYIDDELCDDFEKETGIRVKYDTFDSNENMYSIVKNNEGAYDLLFPSDYMVERMINEDMLEKLDMSNIPNVANIDTRFRNLSFDPDDEYIVPFMWGTVGIMYNSARVTEPVDSWGVLWDEQYTKKIFMLNSVRDTIGLALKYIGFNPNAQIIEERYATMNSMDINELNAAKSMLILQRPLVLSYEVDTIRDKMIANEGDLAVVYSGDAIFCQTLNSDIAYVIPKEGSNLWIDGIVIPKGAKNKTEAEMFIDYLCRPEIAAKASEYVGYSTTNKAALEYISPELKDNPIYWPDDEELDRCEVFNDLGDFKIEYDKAWEEILIGRN